MKKTPRQPHMEEWLLDSLHGLHDGEENENEALKPEYFISSITYEYIKSLQPKKRDWWIERELRKSMSQLLWPRILIARCRVIITHTLPLLSDGKWIITDVALNTLRILMRCLGLILHGLRLMINLASLITPFYTEPPSWEGIKQTISGSWFELFIDTYSLTNTFLPATYLKTTCAFSILELGVFILRGYLELSKLEGFKQSFKNQLAHNNLSKELMSELTEAKMHATALYSHHCKKLILNIAVLSLSIFLFLFKSFVLPSLSLTLVSNPLIPFVFAIVALAISLANHYVAQYFDKEKPQIKISQVSGRISFFKESGPALSSAQHAPESPSQPLEKSFVRNSPTLCLSQ